MGEYLFPLLTTWIHIYLKPETSTTSYKIILFAGKADYHKHAVKLNTPM